MITSSPANVLLGRGKLLFDRLTSAGASTGLRDLESCEELSIETTEERVKIYDYSKASGPLLSDAVTRRETTVTIKLSSHAAANVALALAGDTTGFTQTSGSVTDESVTTSVIKGRVYQTAGRSITAVTVKKSPSTVLVLGTDYDILDAKLGLIHIREGSVTVVDGDTILVTYTRTAITTPGLDRVLGQTAGKIIGKLVYVGDPTDGIAYDLEVWKLSLMPEGGLGLISTGEYSTYQLKGFVLSDEANHPTDPYYHLTKRS